MLTTPPPPSLVKVLERGPEHPFDEAMQLLKVTDSSVGGSRYSCTPHKAYANMVGPYGGITAAQTLQSVMQDSKCVGEPVTLTANYTTPIKDQPFEIITSMKKTNRTTQHWNVDLVQEGSPAVTAMVITGIRRGNLQHLESPMPLVSPPESLDRSKLSKAPLPWLSKYDMRFLKGEPNISPTAPKDGSVVADSESLLWVKDVPDRPLDYVGLASICDVFAPRIFIHRSSYTPAGTISFTVYFHVDSDALKKIGSDFLLAQGRANIFYEGFSDQSVRIWTRAGQLIATGHQVCYFKE